MNKNSKSIVVYTALFGNYDCLIDPREAYEGCDFICFTDQDNLETKIWKQVKVSESFPSPTVANRHFKWLPHRYLDEYEVSLYLDSNILLYVDPKELIDKYLADSDIAMPRHPFRNCIYEEARALICEYKITLRQIYPQVMFYRKSGFTKLQGLMEQNIILRRHQNNYVVNMMEKVWDEIKKWGNYRDQIVFPYVAWNSNVRISLMTENARTNTSFLYLPHKKKTVGTMKKIFAAIRLRKRRYVDANLLKIIIGFAGKNA